MKITVAICTWNRSRLLRQTLSSLAAMNLPRDLQWQVLLVDNASTDDTRQVVQQFQHRLPLKYLFEPRQGHTISRNTAIAHADGEWMVWTDNDVMVEPDWLSAYAAGFQRHPQVAYFGGKILPVFENGMPEWLQRTWEKCRPVYAARDLGNLERPLGDGVFPYGANFAIRTDIQREFLYDEQLGRKAGGMLGEDEISVLRRIDQAGHTGMWLPDAVLQHCIPGDRATPRYVSQYFVGQGQNNILQGKVTKTLRQAWIEFATHRMAWHIKQPFKNPDEWVSHLIRSSLSWGEYSALRQRRRVRS